MANMKNLLDFINENSKEKEYTDDEIKELIESLVINYNGKYIEELNKIIKEEKQEENKSSN